MSKIPRERMISTLNQEPPEGRVPHFELVFFLTMEAFGKLHTSQRGYHQWEQMEERERQLHRNEIADLHIATAERYEHCAIFIHPNPSSTDETLRMIDLVREKSGDKYFLMIHGDATYGIPSGDEMVSFSHRLADDMDGMKAEADAMVSAALARAEAIAPTCSFLSPSQFSEFVTPYLAKLIKGYRDMGFYSIKHTDGNIMPILDQLVQANPHALHSLDPQAGVDIAEVKRLCGDKLCLIGNVNCGLLDTGADQEVIECVRYALKHGMPGGGYILSTSNCIYTGMRLKRYEMMLDIWRTEGNY